MFNRYVVLVACAALVVTLFHAPNAQAKKSVKPLNHTWVRIDEVEGHNWDEVAIYPGNWDQRERRFFSIYVPFFNISFVTVTTYAGHQDNGRKITKGKVRAIGQLHHNNRPPRYNCRPD
jgi:hypothetical protein